MRKQIVLGLGLIAALVLTACGGGGGSTGGADAGRGETLYKQSTIGTASAPGCITCHSLNPGEVLVGPSHAGVATRAADIIKSAEYTGTATTVEEYLRESIVSPDAHLETGFTAGVMYANFGKELSEQEIGDLVAYMATLK